MASSSGKSAADRLPDGTNPLQEASRKAWAEDSGISGKKP